LSPSRAILPPDLPLVAPEPVKLTRKEKQALYEDEQRERKRLFSSR
jgi:hypothetical protein